MTFIPNVLSIIDLNNSTNIATSSYVGSYVNTNGYESICLNIICGENSLANGVKIEFSYDGSTVSKTISDTFFANINYSKTYQILDKYYRIKFQQSASTNVNISTRLLVSSSNEQKQNNFYSSNDSMIDAFGKLRVSNPYTLLDLKFPIAPPNATGPTGPYSEYLNNSELVCTKSFSFTGTTSGNAMRIISANNNATGFYISQSRKYCSYLPGKSMLILCSGIINSGTNSGVSSRIGFFDDYNGFYFEYDSTNINVCYKNNGAITPISQSEWNIDPMDGTGTSTLNLDFTKTQLFVIDFEWLGVGRIRYGFYAFGKINYCHQVTNINSLIAPYIRSANLPIRYELFANGTPGPTGSLTQICSTVISEGGYNPQGRAFSVDNGLPSANNVDNTETALIAIKGGGPNYYHQNIIPSGIDILNTANTTNAIKYRVRLFLSPSTDPGSFTWQNVDNNSVVQYALSPTGVSYTNSILVDEGYFTGRGTNQFNDLNDVFSNFVQITSDINSISDILLLTAQIQTGNAQIACAIKWQEFY